jgi:hypothetical protein
MKPFHAIAWLALLVAALSLPTFAATDSYSAKPIAATVVDAETGQPLEGVNVVARWMLEEKRTGVGVGDLDLMEAVTDKNGKFLFPAWEGKAPPSRKTPVSDTLLMRYETRLSSGSPEITFFKSGYKPTSIGNYNYLNPELRDQYHTWERSSDWNGKIIKLDRFKGNLEIYAGTAAGIASGLGSGIDCAWKKTPRLYASLIKEKHRLDGLGVRNFLPTLQGMERNFKNSGCGSAQEFFEEYLK